MQADSLLKARYIEVAMPKFYSYLPERYDVELRKFAARILAMFASAYLCEQFFSIMKATKTPSNRSRLSDQNLSSVMKVSVANKLQPDINKLVSQKRCQASGHRK